MSPMPPPALLPPSHPSPALLLPPSLRPASRTSTSTGITSPLPPSRSEPGASRSLIGTTATTSRLPPLSPAASSRLRGGRISGDEPSSTTARRRRTDALLLPARRRQPSPKPLRMATSSGSSSSSPTVFVTADVVPIVGLPDGVPYPRLPSATRCHAPGSPSPPFAPMTCVIVAVLAVGITAMPTSSSRSNAPVAVAMEALGRKFPPCPCCCKLCPSDGAALVMPCLLLAPAAAALDLLSTVPPGGTPRPSPALTPSLASGVVERMAALPPPPTAPGLIPLASASARPRASSWAFPIYKKTHKLVQPSSKT